MAIETRTRTVYYSPRRRRHFMTAKAAAGGEASARMRKWLTLPASTSQGANQVTPSTTNTAARELLARAYEVVHHDAECPAIGGNGDDDCRCDAVPFLRALEQRLALPTGELVAAATDVLRISDRKHDAWDRLRAALSNTSKQAAVEAVECSLPAQQGLDRRVRGGLRGLIVPMLPASEETPAGALVEIAAAVGLVAFAGLLFYLIGLSV